MPLSPVQPPPPERHLTPEQRLAIYEAWWPLLARVSSFFLGGLIMGYETVVAHADRPWLIAAATGMMGLPVANVLGKMLSSAAQQGQDKDGQG